VLFLGAIPMIPSPAFVATPGSERSPCEGFSLGKTFHFGSLKFVADQFSHLSLSSFGDHSGAAMGPAGGEPSLLQRTGMGGASGGTPPLLAWKGGPTSFSHGGTTRRLLQLQPRPWRDRRTLRLIKQRWQSRCSRRCRGRKTTSPSSNGVLTERPHDYGASKLVDTRRPAQANYHNTSPRPKKGS
jgi:hypothetical protein